MRIIITRHGETEENRTRTIMGHSPGVLSELGKKQAQKLANRLKSEEFDLIISSDLARAFDTAKTISKFHDTPMSVSQKLRERNLGALQGKVFEKKGSPGRFSKEDFDKHCESEENIFSRARDIVDEVINGQVENVLLVGHSGINKAIVGALTGKTASEIWDLESQDNTAVTIFEGDSNDLKLKLSNCTRHLDED